MDDEKQEDETRQAEQQHEERPIEPVPAYEGHENEAAAAVAGPEITSAPSDEQDGEQEDDFLSAYELNEVIETLCLSKVEEFQLLGYEYVSGKDIWECVSDKYRKKGIPPLHQIVNDILSLKSTQFMNWMTMSAYKGAQF